MRIAIIFHANQKRAGSGHAIGPIAEIWRAQGHDVQHLVGCREDHEADIAILHVDLSVVPTQYVTYARRFPVVINGRILDIRKTRVSSNLLSRRSSYSGAVIVKSNLNSEGISEHKLGVTAEHGSGVEGIWRRLRRYIGTQQQASSLCKGYSVHRAIDQVPEEVWADSRFVVEKFRPEREGDWYFVRRTFIFGDSTISYRMGDKQPIVNSGHPDVFEWVETPAQVLEVCRKFSLEYGTVDYSLNNGEFVFFDINKTPGRARPQTDSGVKNYEAILRTVAGGITKFYAVNPISRARIGSFIA